MLRWVNSFSFSTVAYEHACSGLQLGYFALVTCFALVAHTEGLACLVALGVPKVCCHCCQFISTTCLNLHRPLFTCFSALYLDEMPL